MVELQMQTEVLSAHGRNSKFTRTRNARRGLPSVSASTMSTINIGWLLIRTRSCATAKPLVNGKSGTDGIFLQFLRKSPFSKKLCRQDWKNWQALLKVLKMTISRTLQTCLIESSSTSRWNKKVSKTCQLTSPPILISLWPIPPKTVSNTSWSSAFGYLPSYLSSTFSSPTCPKKNIGMNRDNESLKKMMISILWLRETI